MDFTSKEQKTIKWLRQLQGRRGQLYNWARIFASVTAIGGSIMWFSIFSDFNVLAMLQGVYDLKTANAVHLRDREKVNVLFQDCIDEEDFFEWAGYAFPAFLLGFGLFSLIDTIGRWGPTREQQLLLKLLDQNDSLKK